MGTDVSTAGWAVSVPLGYRAGRWVVTEPIATGQWGSVYAAAGGDAEVALKFLPTGTVTPRQVGHLREMAEREARGHARLTGHRLIRSLEVLTLDDPAHPELDGAVVIVLERAAASLADRLRQAAGQPVPDAPRLLAETCEGLVELHSAGWVHGDLKPDNILVMPDGSVRLSDFGLAVELEGTHGYLPPVGSSDYVPPERSEEALGERGLAVRASADIWAFGITACQLLSGRSPFDGATARARALAADRYAAGQGELILRGLPGGWRPIVRDCLAPTHAQRQAHDATEVLARIRELDGPPARTRSRLAIPAVLLLMLIATLFAVTGSERPNTDEYRPDLLRTGAGIPPQYRRLIVAAAQSCNEPGVSPVLIAAMLQAESDFDAGLSDPAKDEYGIARWTPSVLRFYLPEGQRAVVPAPPFSPSMSIAAMGRYLCFLAPRLAGIPGDPALLLAGSYRTSATTIVKANGIPTRLDPYVGRVRQNMGRYQP
ncbi:serine/threonine protein kinase [Actinoplanes tereljensis]|uniref:Protein kinase domain-containing protein n=1 Tax=Paractinoplanes tereljensis TaxID=571912 RepID=A0A919TWS3_9ACTN|nr:serine/threonine-protein kinase [Actinoplanes tereljensis]GIF23182.1 hypothetical protein Ate02nite_59120 [Actinoplanes tereljensis]